VGKEGGREGGREGEKERGLSLQQTSDAPLREHFHLLMRYRERREREKFC
jgi:hypothetical protein